jgi:uncharacterized protein YdhG (YjbR/CyaY superfamily)
MPQRESPIDEYLATVSGENRRVLEKICGTIRAAVPGADECISYGLPTFKVDGRPLMAVGAWAKHCALYPMSGKAVAALRDALDGFSTSKGTIRFTAEKPLPVAIVKKLVKARLAEIAAKPKRGAKKATATKATPRMPAEKTAAKETKKNPARDLSGPAVARRMRGKGAKSAKR